MGRFKKILMDGVSKIIDDLIPSTSGLNIGSESAPFDKLFVNELNVSSGTNANRGTVTANGSTAVAVSNTSITANSTVIFTLKTVGGTPAGAPYLSAVSAGSGFSVKAAVGDTSVYNYVIIG